MNMTAYLDIVFTVSSEHQISAPARLVTCWSRTLTSYTNLHFARRDSSVVVVVMVDWRLVRWAPHFDH
ncbi:hypothetical protein MLD38_001226 [Melastoma candidum]|uniref:Uncharacterized protein n=1 Tax=Melastoma candidum TaxID=119954 RepID=A0ACB9SFV9_9MYRT|nr:hypothetical protein MLD38_001226 [Melastoma candidum]